MLNFYEKLLVGRYLEFDPPPRENDGPEVNGFQTIRPRILHLNPSESLSRPNIPKTTTSAEAASAPAFAENMHAINLTEAQRNEVFGGPESYRKIKGRAQSIQRAVGNQLFRQRVSLVKEGPTTKGYRNFMWLPWIPGSVSEVRPSGIDVLTGPMSGCWITTYLRGGSRYVGHVGTTDASVTDSKRAKDAWNTFAANTPAFNYKGFNPARVASQSALTAKSGEGSRHCYALVTGTLEFYALIVYSAMGSPRRQRIASIQQAQESMPPFGQVEHVKIDG